MISKVKDLYEERRVTKKTSNSAQMVGFKAKEAYMNGEAE